MRFGDRCGDGKKRDDRKMLFTILLKEDRDRRSFGREADEIAVGHLESPPGSRLYPERLVL